MSALAAPTMVTRATAAFRCVGTSLRPPQRNASSAPTGLSLLSRAEPRLRTAAFPLLPLRARPAHAATTAQFKTPGEGSQPKHGQHTEATPQSQSQAQSQAQSQGESQALSKQAPAPLQRGGQGGAGRALQTRPGPGALADLLSPWFPGDRSLQQMLSSVDRMFDEMMAPAWQGWRQPGLLGGRGLGDLGALAVRPPWDVQEDQTAYHLRFDLPGEQPQALVDLSGMDKEEVRVRVDDDDVLHIYAEHKAETAEGDRWKSRVARNYQTSVMLPDNIKKEDIAAEMKHGVLSVTVPKAPEEEARGHMEVPIA